MPDRRLEGGSLNIDSQLKRLAAIVLISLLPVTSVSALNNFQPAETSEQGADCLTGAVWTDVCLPDKGSTQFLGTFPGPNGSCRANEVATETALRSVPRRTCVYAGPRVWDSVRAQWTAPNVKGVYYTETEICCPKTQQSRFGIKGVR